MEWYYAQNNQQAGPVSDVEFTGLVTAGAVTDQTLVWHAGMAEWQPYGEVKAGLVRPPPPSSPSPVATLPPDQALCAECGRIFARDETVQFGSASVCAGCKPVYVQKLKEGVVKTDTGPLLYSGFWLRFAAKFIDLLALGLVIGIPTTVLMFSRMSAMEASGSSDTAAFEFLGLQILLQFLSVAATVGYNTFFIGRYGATPGKMAVGIKVVTAEGVRPTYWRAFGRAWAEQLSGMVCYIGYIIAAFDDQRRALHDHICNTRVVMK